jgi:histidinol dehydrogenase
LTLFLDASASDFGAKFREFVSARREQSVDVQESVRAILSEVRKRGDAALAEFTRKFDGFDPISEGFAIPPAAMKAAFDAIPGELRDALRFAHDRIEAHHRRQLPADERYRDSAGAELGHRWSALQSVGLYVPGGKAAYPSSVLMNAVPAKVAGVERIVMVAPAPGGELSPLVLAAAHVAGIGEAYKMGGAQAVAALAYGTDTIAPVAKIVGPGNAYVTEAKRQVFGAVGIDTIAGPSEVVVVADAGNDPDWIAADLLAQAEHDEAAQAILITDDSGLAGAVKRAVEAQLAAMPRRGIAGKSWADHGAIIVAGDLLEDAPALIDALAPEHLELPLKDAERLVPRIRNAGAIFIGEHTPEAVGDYVAGSNHVLPTARAARYASGLGVLDFMKRTSLLKLDAASLAALAPATMALAAAEGLDGHRHSVAVRIAGAAQRSAAE